MMTFFTAVWEWIKWAFTGLMPFAEGRSIGPTVRWIIWIVLDLAFLGLLYFLNYQFKFYQSVDLRGSLAQLGWLRDFWLPILGQLVIFTGVVLYWFYLLWFSDPDASPFPDIDDAWHEAIRALGHAGIQLPRVPLFLVLGRPASSEERLFEASGLKLTVKQTPANPNAPIHVFAERDGVYVTCRGASVLGKLAGMLTLDDLPEGVALGDQDAAGDIDSTHRGGSKEQGILELLRASAGGEASPTNKRTMRRAAMGKPLGSDFMSDPKEVARFKARLAHLCRLIARDRQPFCAANGILLLVPLAGTDRLDEAQLTAQAAHDDLNVARHHMKLDCPLVTLLVDMEELPGFVEFMRRQPSRELGTRRGSGFPMSTRLSREEVLEEIRTSLAWICTTYVQDSVYRAFQAETAASPDPLPLIPGNSRLALLLDEMNERTDSLALIVQQAIAPERDALFRYSGCYLSATGEKGSQAFVAGVFQKLVKEQSAVSWTQTALAEDSQCHVWASYYFIMALVLLVVWVGLVVWRVMF
jgi:IcmF-related N-terminal domain